MGWIDTLAGTIVGLDAAPLIYYAEEHPRYLPIVEPFFDALDRGTFQAVASTVILLEVLVLPLRNHEVALAQAYRDILLSSNAITLIPVHLEIAERAAQLRANTSMRTPDAIHIATALQSGATHFITNDNRLSSIPGLQVIAMDDMLKGA